MFLLTKDMVLILDIGSVKAGYPAVFIVHNVWEKIACLHLN